MHIVYETLYNLDIQGKTIITLFNKQDKVTDEEPLRDFKADYTLPIAAKSGQGFAELEELLCKLLRDNKILLERVIPYDKAGVIQQIRRQGELLAEEYQADGIYVKAYVPMELYGKL